MFSVLITIGHMYERLCDTDDYIFLFNSRWFHNRKCKPSPPRHHAAESISIEDVAGLFIILGAGVVLALGTSLFEYCYRVKRRRKATKNRVKIPYSL